jgi:hypothetical protein
VLDSVPLLPTGTSFRAARGRMKRQPTFTGPPTTGAGHRLREQLGPEKLLHGPSYFVLKNPGSGRV